MDMSKVTSGISAAHDYLGDKLLRMFGGLVMEQKTEDGQWVVSTGRVMLWAVFGHLMYLWTAAAEGKAPDPTELNAFYALLAYAGVKIVKDVPADTMAAFKGTGQ